MSDGRWHLGKDGVDRLNIGGQVVATIEQKPGAWWWNICDPAGASGERRTRYAAQRAARRALKRAAQEQPQ